MESTRYLAVLLGVGLLAVCRDSGKGKSHELSEHLPSPTVVSPWRPSGPPQFVQGSDPQSWLGDASDAYLEYGLERACLVSYGDGTGRRLRLELHEMGDAAGAYGIFTFQRQEGCEPVPMGDEACLDAQQLNVWKGRFLVTVAGYGSHPSIRAGLLTLARATCETIAETGTRPEIIELLPEAGLDATSIRYLEGPLALRGAHDFGSPESPLEVQEAAAARMGQDRVFVFRYATEGEAERALRTAVAKLSGPHLYQQLLLGDPTFRPVEDAGEPVAMTTKKTYVLMATGSDISRLSSTLELLRQRVGSR